MLLRHGRPGKFDTSISKGGRISRTQNHEPSKALDGVWKHQMDGTEMNTNKFSNQKMKRMPSRLVGGKACYGNVADLRAGLNKSLLHSTHVFHSCVEQK